MVIFMLAHFFYVWLVNPEVIEGRAVLGKGTEIWDWAFFGVRWRLIPGAW